MTNNSWWWHIHHNNNNYFYGVIEYHSSKLFPYYLSQVHLHNKCTNVCTLTWPACTCTQSMKFWKCISHPGGIHSAICREVQMGSSMPSSSFQPWSVGLLTCIVDMLAVVHTLAWKTLFLRCRYRASLVGGILSTSFIFCENIVILLGQRHWHRQCRCSTAYIQSLTPWA